MQVDLSPIDRHTMISACYSGGKDSLACVYLLRPFKDRITIYHLDTGDLLPEVREIVEHVKSFWPNFVHIRGNVDGWIKQNGMPTDLLPHGSHAVGRSMGEEKTRLVPRYDCCFSNLMWPLYERIKADGNTLVIRGTKTIDMNRLPVESGAAPDGVEVYLPIKDWTNEQVFSYLRSVGAPISRIYDHVTNSPECARCPAWWGEKRAAYLKQFHPALFADYASRMKIIAREIEAPLRNFQHEIAECGGTS